MVNMKGLHKSILYIVSMKVINNGILYVVNGSGIGIDIGHGVRLHDNVQVMKLIK